MPKNTNSKTAKNYTGTIPLQHKVQSRQLRQTHPDAHYAAAVFRYMRGLAVKFRENTILLSVDDKSKVDVGEPGLPISSGVRGKKSIVPTGTILGSLDHDFHQKGSLTPSVCLNIDVPSDLRESFYRGQVSVILKDSIFMASSPFRHAAEIKSEVLRARKIDEENHRPERNILMIYSDGGPDHRLTYDSVKVSLIALFKSLDLDMLLAARTAPGHSWANPVERIMSILNLGYQNCAIDRNRCPDEIETLIKNCNGMESIRSQAVKHPQIKGAWATAVEPIIDTLNKRTERLRLKDKPFEVRSPATDDQIESMNSFAELIDPSLDLDHLQKKDTSKCEEFQKFLRTHCRVRNYSFQIKKCDNLTCCQRSPELPELQWLPDPVPMETGDHYKQLEEVLGTETDESHRPSLRDDTKTIASEQQGCGASMLTAQRVRKTVECSLCEKPRCIFSQRKLTDQEHSGLKRLRSRYHFICGANITPEGDVLEGVVFVNLKMTCESHVEFSYYSSKIGRQDVCCYCGSVGAERDPEMIQRYRTVLPKCDACLVKDTIKRQPISGK